jgi:hypothetical protein
VSKLKSLDEHNREASERWAFHQKRHPPNGIACPLCGTEMVDSSPMMELTTAPPQKEIHCPACKYKDTRIS